MIIGNSSKQFCIISFNVHNLYIKINSYISKIPHKGRTRQAGKKKKKKRKTTFVTPAKYGQTFFSAVPEKVKWISFLAFWSKLSILPTTVKISQTNCWTQIYDPSIWAPSTIRLHYNQKQGNKGLFWRDTLLYKTVIPFNTW